MMKNYRVRVETNDGCVTIWYEKSKAIRAGTIVPVILSATVSTINSVV